MTFVCPICKGPLESNADEYRCPVCDKTYPIVLGIPDFRVFPDPWIEIEDDWAKANRLAERYDDLSFEELVRYYWLITPDTPAHLADRYTRHVLGGVDRGIASLAEIERLTGPIPGDRFLEFGCGTGGFLIAARRRFRNVVGIDIAFRWLVLARKRLDEARIRDVTLVCCCGEYLPFPDRSFDLAVASDVIEHTADQVGMVKQALRALAPDGRLFLATPNRLSLSPEPHVRVFGVGWLPRPWMAPYVKLVRGIDYRNIRTISYFELRAILEAAGARDYQILLPSIPEAELSRYGPSERALICVYHRAIETAPLRWPLYVVGPLFHAVCRPGGD
jgi:SAM-dependent methyltransferase